MGKIFDCEREKVAFLLEIQRVRYLNAREKKIAIFIGNSKGKVFDLHEREDDNFQWKLVISSQPVAIRNNIQRGENAKCVSLR